MGGHTRREFVKAGVVVTAGLPVASGLVAAALSGCGPSETQPAASPEPKPAPAPAPAPARAPAPAPAPAPAAAPAAPPPSAGASTGGALVTEVPAMAPLVTALQYVHESSRPDQSCKNCQFYTAEGDTRGRCTMFQEGLVEVSGWCTSWTAKVATG